MSLPRYSPRALELVGALNRRGIVGRRVRTLLKRYSQRHLALHIDYYDHEVVFRGKLPHWAATPWLEYRIRHDVAPPGDFLLTSGTLTSQLLGS